MSEREATKRRPGRPRGSRSARLSLTFEVALSSGALDQPCWSCGVEASDWCVTRDGTGAQQLHTCRFYSAARAQGREGRP